MYTILLLTEEPLNEHDVSRVASLHGDEPIDVHLLVPADADHNRLIEALDEVALGRLREALDDDEPTPQEAEQEAMHAVNASRELLKAAGVEAAGSVTGHDPVAATIEAAAHYDADELIVVTPPHLVAEALHRDWASRLRDELDLPVLHFVSGTDRVIG
ncbi:MAG: hypothetical protein QOE19_490 [Actinomycetota bacterium]|nr:hypothetical protein [Actinomycetota bacterium]MDQ1667073.1 hypothetical protein [Actinomycetota bacterium]MDQ1669522.1 hypothetical protein [Actinomycetota bacterium]